MIMPIDYKKYPSNWKTEIRPAILERAKNCCEFCGVPNHKLITRGIWNNKECYQDEDGTIYDADTSEVIGSVETKHALSVLGKVNPTNKVIKVVLTIAHLDHDVNNNDFSNLKALCQRCHNRYDASFRKQNRKKNKGILSLF
jgi:ribosomal protein L37AE/L43A